ncbi:MAG: hypothetical protein K8S55_05735 [Phycisphaerae bacterium]|nr:hypothetical protein [Phycisphaerae bacterium]
MTKLSGKILVGLAIITLVFHVQCSSRKEDCPGNEPRVTLKEHYPPGKYVMTYDQKMTQQVKSQGQNANISSSTLMTIHLDVNKPGADGCKTAILRYKRIEANINGIVIDTDDPPVKPKKKATGFPSIHAPQSQSSSPKKLLDSIFREFINARITIRLTPDDEIAKIEGSDVLWDRLAKKLPHQAQQMVSEFKKTMGDKMTMDMFSATKGMLPSKAVGVKAVWHPTITKDLPFMGKASYEAECELLDLRDTSNGKLAVVAFTSKITEDDITNKNISNMGVAIFVSDMELQHTGEFQIDVDTGIMKRFTMQQNGTVEMDASPSGGKKVTMTTKLNNSITYTVEYRK